MRIQPEQIEEGKVFTGRTPGLRRVRGFTEDLLVSWEAIDTRRWHKPRGQWPKGECDIDTFLKWAVAEVRIEALFA